MRLPRITTRWRMVAVAIIGAADSAGASVSTGSGDGMMTLSACGAVA